MPLTLTLSPQAGRGDVDNGFVATCHLLSANASAKDGCRCTADAACFLLPACGEKVAGRPDEGQLRDAIT
ncbi:hypothetical protein AC244_31150 [Ensifer adhaerens]|uniref:Uncharacterized protein n=1 Tax=Ensifer adhaerens TaxID=106592 RepID=A0A0L8BFV7_ENSAD|nr:hypothetical protein AC244_31150 [Ensifer adhaerens]